MRVYDFLFAKVCFVPLILLQIEFPSLERWVERWLRGPREREFRREHPGAYA